MNTTWITEPKAKTSSPVSPKKRFLLALIPLAYPVGAYYCWKKKDAGLGFKLAYTVLGLPVFLVLFSFVALLVFAAFLPPVDTSMGNRPDRTVVNSLDNYASTFVKTGNETKGAYELVQVEIGPKGGNDWHYHKTFDEQFTVLKGELSVGLNGKVLVLHEGETVTAPKGSLHYFGNPTSKTTLMRVKIMPASGLEKSIRVAYGLMNTGQWSGNGPYPKNLWHLSLLLAYSQTYLADVPGFIQEPLMEALARVAQWKGEDKALEVFFK